MAEDKKVFAGGGMDMDSEERFISSNDYRYALNCRITSSDEDNVGVVENIKGNERLYIAGNAATIPNSEFDESRYQVIGAYENKQTNSLFYFICDTDGINHAIVSDFNNGTFYTIAYGGFLNFDINHLITGINLVVDDEDYPDGILYWTDNFNEPSKLDVRRAFYHTQTNNIPFPDSYKFLDEKNIKAVLYPPTTVPIVKKGTDEKREQSNYIKGNVWQFKYRYVYRNNGKSSWSPISDIISTRIGTYEEQTHGIENENYIEVQVDSGDFEVKSIEVAVRKTQDKEDFYLVGVANKDDGIPQNNFYLSSFGSPGNIPNGTVEGEIISQDISQNSPLYFVFRNNELFIPLPLQETIRLFDDVPQLAKSQELIDGNRLVYGNVLNGYDPVETNCEIDIIYQEGAEYKTVQIIVERKLSQYSCDNCDVGGRHISKFMLDFHLPESNGGINIPDGANCKIQILDYIGAVWQYRGSPGLCETKEASTVFGVTIDAPDFVWGPSGFHGIVQPSDLKDYLKTYSTVSFKSYSDYDDDIGLRIYPGYDVSGTNCMPSNPAWQESMPHDFTNNTSDYWSSPGSIHGVRFTFSVYNADWLSMNCLAAHKVHAGWGISERKMNKAHEQNWGGFRHLWGSHSGGWAPTEHCGIGNPFNSYYNSMKYGKGWDDYHNLSLITNPKKKENNCQFTYLVEGLNEYRGFKSGSEHGFGIVYYDEANRSTTVNKIGEKYFPLQPERGFPLDPAIVPDLFHNAASVKITIKHKPPSWASHYQIVYTGSKNVVDFMHLNVDFYIDNSFDSRYLTSETDSLTAKTQGDGHSTAERDIFVGDYQSILKPTLKKKVIKMDMEAMIHRSTDTNTFKMAWQWAPGDRVRFIHRPDGMKLYDYEIVGTEEWVGGNTVFYILGQEAVKDFSYIGYVSGVSGNSTLEGLDVFVEVYRPEKEADVNIYYEFGHVNPIIDDENGDKAHSVNSVLNEWSVATTPSGAFYKYYDDNGSVITSPHQDQITGIQPAIMYIENGDIHWKLRRTQTAVGDYKVEDYSFSDYFKSFGWGEGRPNSFLPNYKQIRRQATIFYSEPYIANTKINGLSTFYPDVSFQEYDLRFNSIQKLHSINDSLIIFQEDKVSRAMVSRDVIFDASGEQNVAISKNVLSSAIPYVGDYGICTNPESFASFGFRSYFFDIRRGAVMRLSQDGLTPISEARMKNFFTDYCEEVMDNRKQRKFNCYGVYDDKFDEYIISIPIIRWQVANSQSLGGYDHHYITGFTTGFNEPSKKWNSFYSYSPGYLCSFNTGIVSFKNGTIWKHNSSNVDYNTYYQTKYSSQLDIISNSSPDLTKIYNNIKEESTDIWEAEINTRNGQNTTVLTNNFTGGQTFSWEEGHGTKENIHHAVIMGDENSSGGKIEGDRIRDTSIMASLSLPIGPAQEENTLFSVKFGIAPSGSPDLLGNVSEK